MNYKIISERRFLIGILSLVIFLISMTSAQAVEKENWHLVYENNFDNGGIEGWSSFPEGKVKAIQGEMVIENPEGGVEVFLREPTFPGRVRIEFDAYIPEGSLCDVSPYLNSSGHLTTGYLLQFGGLNNRSNRLLKRGDNCCEGDNSILLRHNHVFHIIAENNGGHIRLIVDGKALIDYEDPDNLATEKNLMPHGYVGIYTHKSKVHIDNMKIYQKK